MKTKVYLLYFLTTTYLLTVVSCNSNSPTNSRTDWSELSLKGSVKSLRQIDYPAIEQGGVVTKGERKPGISFSDEFKLFNEKGMLLEENSSMSVDDLGLKVAYKYDEQGYKIERVGKYNDGSVLFKNTIKYSSDRHTVETKTYKGGDKFEQKDKAIYDDNFRLIEQFGYEPDGKQFYKSTYKYDQDGNIKEHSYFDETDKLQSRTTYTYDKQGNQVEYFLYRGDGTIDSHVSYTYEFDNKNNWVRCVHVRDGKPFIISEREIKYF